MAARLAQHGTAPEQARRAQPALFDGERQPMIGSAAVANTGKAAHQGPFEHDVCALCEEADRPSFIADEVHVVGIHMHVCVDQARQQHAPAAIDGARVRRDDDTGSRRRDLPSLHEHGPVVM